jgi:hypothetical protein
MAHRNRCDDRKVPSLAWYICSWTITTDEGTMIFGLTLFAPVTLAKSYNLSFIPVFCQLQGRRRLVSKLDRYREYSAYLLHMTRITFLISHIKHAYDSTSFLDFLEQRPTCRYTVALLYETSVMFSISFFISRVFLSLSVFFLLFCSLI